MTEIVQREHPALRANAKKVPVEEITGKHIRSVIARMKEALHAEPDGVAIAAPQIGESLRIFVVSGGVLEFLDGAIEKMDLTKESAYPDKVFINPAVINRSKGTQWMEEGCLSIRYLYGKIKRAKKVKVAAHDETGKAFERGGSGLLAQIFQHEIDHLEGILFTDNATDVHDLPPSA